jgi:hypothetical protein
MMQIMSIQPSRDLADLDPALRHRIMVAAVLERDGRLPGKISIAGRAHCELARQLALHTEEP